MINQNLGKKKFVAQSSTTVCDKKKKLEDNFLRLNNEESTNTSKTKCVFKTKHAYICKKIKENPRLLWLLGSKIFIHDSSRARWVIQSSGPFSLLMKWTSLSPPPPSSIPCTAQIDALTFFSFLFLFSSGSVTDTACSDIVNKDRVGGFFLIFNKNNCYLMEYAILWDRGVSIQHIYIWYHTYLRDPKSGYWGCYKEPISK